jgi:O-antigen ligase
VRWLLLLFIVTCVGSDVFGVEMSLVTGISVKNLWLYLIVFGVLFRLALTGVDRVFYVSLHVAFVLLIGYAGATWIIAALVVKYPGYHLFAHLVTLKNMLIDPALLLLAAFYGLRDMADSRFVLKALILAIGFANFLTNLDTAHIIHLGMKIGERGAEEGRVFGAFGHANETGALLVCTLPAMVAFAYTTRGLQRAMWAFVTLCSAVVLLMTVSRGAFVGLFVGGIGAMWLCRRYVPLRRFAVGGFIALFLAVLAVVIAGIVNPSVSDLITHRLLGTAQTVDAGEMSSGRTAIWAALLRRMAQTPTTFITGFGWDVYSTMPFRYIPHNQYLSLWFELGLTGMLSLIFIQARTLLETLRTIAVTEDRAIQAQLLAFVFGFMMVAVAIFFVNLITPWPYVWLYVGVILKMCSLLQTNAERSFTPLRVAEAPRRPVARPVHGAFPRPVR